MPVPYTSRLNPTQLNNLNVAYILSKNYALEEGSIIVEKLPIDFKKISNDTTPIFIFQAVSDVKKQQKRENLKYINDLICKFNQDNHVSSKQKTTLLIPLMQSRLWKKHCVLVEVTLDNGKKEINIHDSQSWWHNLFYPNCLKNLKKQGYQLRYNNYAKQSDNYSCTFFVYHYIKEILNSWSSRGLKNISCSLTELTGKGEDPIGEIIKKNLEQSTILASPAEATPWKNISVDSGENIPWNKEACENYFKGKSKEKFTVDENDDFLIVENNSEGSTSINSDDTKKSNGNTIFLGNHKCVEAADNEETTLGTEAKMRLK